MEVAYKYCDANGVRILEDLRLKVTPPNQFNDPFEFTPNMICSSPTRAVKQIFTKKVVRDLFDDHQQAGYKGDFRLFRKQLREQRPEIIKSLVPKLPEAIEERRDKQLERISVEHGVLCLSSTPSSLLMWGHYGNKHQGIVIGLDASWSVFERRGKKGLRPVTYCKERVLCDTAWPQGSAKELEYTERLVFSKNDEWDYENEWRQVFTLRGLIPAPLYDGTIGYFLPLPHEVIVSVYFGYRCQPQLEKNVRSILAKPEFSHVKIQRAILHPSEFALVFS